MNQDEINRTLVALRKAFALGMRKSADPMPRDWTALEAQQEQYEQQLQEIAATLLSERMQPTFVEMGGEVAPSVRYAKPFMSDAFARKSDEAKELFKQIAKQIANRLEAQQAIEEEANTVPSFVHDPMLNVYEEAE